MTTIGCIAPWMFCCPTRKNLEKHLKNRLGELFSLEYDLLLYDITSTYFEGQAAGQSLWRNAVILATNAVTANKSALGWSCLVAGCRWDTRCSPETPTDVTTVEQIVETMEVALRQVGSQCG